MRADDVLGGVEMRRQPAATGRARRLPRDPGHVRLGEALPLLRRILGLPYLSIGNFLPNVGDATDAERIRGLARRARGPGPAPLLILGVMPRSGTNFVRDILAAHPDVAADPGRLHEFPLLHAAAGSTAHMDEVIAYFPPNAEVVGRHDGLAMLAGAWLRELQREAGARHILLKSPHVQNLTLAPLVFPDARILLCLRDGRDVIDSTLRTFPRRSLRRKTFTQLASEWRLATEAILSFAEGGANRNPDVMVIRYEDLVADRGPALAALLDHLGLDRAGFDLARAAALPVRGSSRSELDGAARWQPQARRGDFKPVGRWHDWSPRRRARFDRIAGEVLERAGYDRAV